MLSKNLPNYFHNFRFLLFSCFVLWIILIILYRFSENDVPKSVNYYNYHVSITDAVDNDIPINVLLNHSDINIILFWTTYFSEDILQYSKSDFRGVESPPFYRMRYCEKQFPNCLITTDKRFIDKAKSVIFHWRDLSVNELPHYRTPEQLWTLYNLESPANSKKIVQSNNAVFNLTATYRYDSDIVVPYGKIAIRDSPLNDSDPQLKVELRYKSKPIAWFVSNCQTKSHREDYVKELTKFIKVDIYGKCGNLDCPPSNGEKCWQMVEHQYLFYLSFENSICKDYVTEKLFNVMNYGVIPVVFGGANYSSFMPPNSYIDATELSPKHLAQLMVNISNKKKHYLSYFQWRKHYKVVQSSSYNYFLFCQMCQLMNEKQKRKSFTSNDINNWYFDNNSCDFKKVKFF